MALFYLIRHGTNDVLAHSIAGRNPGVHLNESGRQQAGEIAEVLASNKISRIVSSPLDRARETAEPLATRLGLQVFLSDRVNEVDFGDWTGLTMKTLDALPEWKRWNVFRSGVRIPKGETIAEVQSRMIAEMQDLQRDHPDDVVAIFSHGDPIRTALAYWLGISLDSLLKFEVATASISIVALGDWGAVVKGINVPARGIASFGSRAG